MIPVQPVKHLIEVHEAPDRVCIVQHDQWLASLQMNQAAGDQQVIMSHSPWSDCSSDSQFDDGRATHGLKVQSGRDSLSLPKFASHFVTVSILLLTVHFWPRNVLVSYIVSTLIGSDLRN